MNYRSGVLYKPPPPTQIAVVALLVQEADAHVLAIHQIQIPPVAELTQTALLVSL